TQARTLDIPAAGETILLVDDDLTLQEVAVELLRGAGYSVLAASSATEALALLDRHAGGIDLLLTDVVMPGASGSSLARSVLASRPGTRVLYTSGYTNDALVH